MNVNELNGRSIDSYPVIFLIGHNAHQFADKLGCRYVSAATATSVEMAEWMNYVAAGHRLVIWQDLHPRAAIVIYVAERIPPELRRQSTTVVVDKDELKVHTNSPLQLSAEIHKRIQGEFNGSQVWPSPYVEHHQIYYFDTLISEVKALGGGLHYYHIVDGYQIELWFNTEEQLKSYQMIRTPVDFSINTPHGLLNCSFPRPEWL